MTPGLERDIVDRGSYDHNVAHLRGLGAQLPRLADLADPPSRLAAKAQEIAGVDPDSADARNLFRVHWHNGPDRRSLADVPEHLVLPESLTGVKAKIIVALGNRFPMINAHKVLAAYGCLIPRLLSGAFDVTRHRAVWPSTGNYCRGGVAIAKLLGCRSVAVLPEGMSRERFNWLEEWVVDPGDIHRTPGTESNVKEIYDACHVLAQGCEQNLILNQFAEYGNYIVAPRRHRTRRWNGSVSANMAGLTAAQRRAPLSAPQARRGRSLRATISSTSLGAHTCVVEALECPTLLYNGYGEHNIQGIGDKHVPLHPQRHGYGLRHRRLRPGSDSAQPRLQHVAGRSYLSQGPASSAKKPSAASAISACRPSPTCWARSNTPSTWDLGPDDAVLTVATDGAEMYELGNRAWPQTNVLRRRPVRLSSRQPKLWPAPAWGGRSTTVSELRSLRPRADLQSRLLHLGRAAGHDPRRLRPPPRPGLLGRIDGIGADLGWHDR